MRKIYYVVLVFLFLYSCNNDYGGFAIQEDSEFEKNLILTYSDTIGTHSWDDGTITQHEGVFFKYHYLESVDTIFIWQGSIVIESFICNVKSDSNFITIDQKPLDLIFGKIEPKGFSPHRPKWPGNYQEGRRMFKESSIHRYWIINKKTKDIYGGYKKEVFDSVYKNLNIPKELNF